MNITLFSNPDEMEVTNLKIALDGLKLEQDLYLLKHANLNDDHQVINQVTERNLLAGLHVSMGVYCRRSN